MTRTIFAALFLFSILFSTAQEQAKVTDKTESFKKLYNQKNHSQIYSMFSPTYKSRVKEEAFIDFVTKNLYNSYGELESNEYLKTEGPQHTYISHFKLGDLLLNISVDEEERIDNLEFLPYYGIPKTKRLEYLSDNKDSTSLDSIIDKLVKDYMQSPQNCGLSIGVYTEGKKYYYNYGELKRNTGTLPTENTIYEIGSLTKVFCGLLLAQAITEKEVNADDDIRLFLPVYNYKNLQVGETPIRLIHLANHSSGLPTSPENLNAQRDYDPLNPYKNYNKEMIFNYLKNVKLETEPGRINEYSTLGMALLGIILEKVYNKSFEELVIEKICKPNGLESTAIKLSTEQQSKFATGYNSNGRATPYWDLGDMAAAGGLKSSTKDMLAFLENNLLEKNEAIKLSTQTTYNKGEEVAMGWHILKTKPGNRLVWHNGGTFGFSGFIGFIKEKKCAVVVLSNSGSMVDYISLGILKYLQQ